MEAQLLKRIVEAVLLAAAQPLSLTQLAALFTEEEAVDNGQLLAALQSLAADCGERGIELKEVASGYRYQIREDVHSWVTRLWTERQTKYSRALLETLALIAYRQPITRAEIEQIRGVAVSSSIVKTLEEREWVRVVGYRDVPGRPALFGTSRTFLDYFNLKSLDELPPLAEIRDLDEYDPQLDLAPVVPPSLELPPEDEDEDENEAHASDDDDTQVRTDDLAAVEPSAVEAERETAPAPEAAAAETAAPMPQPVPAEPGADVELDASSLSVEYLPAADEAHVGAAAIAPPVTPSSPDDDAVDPTDTTTSDDVPEHTA